MTELHIKKNIQNPPPQKSQKQLKFFSFKYLQTLWTKGLTGTFGVWALAGKVKVAQQVWGQVFGVVGNISALNGAPCQLEQRRRVIGHLFDKAHHQWVTAETELMQVHQAEDFSRQVGEQVVVKT